MSKLGYFLGGTLAGVIGTAIAAYAVDAYSSSSSSSSSDEIQEEDMNLEMEMFESADEKNEAAEAEAFSESADEAAPA